MSYDIFNLIDLKNIKPYPYKVKIEGNCTITNYKGNKSSVKNPFTIKQVNEQIEVKGLIEQKYIDLHSTLEAFAKIAGMDGNGENLTVEDLKLARQDFGLNKDVWNNMGVTSFRYDPSETVANLTIDGNTLRIDFDNNASKPQAIKKADNNSESKTNKADNANIKSVDSKNETAETKKVSTNPADKIGKTASTRIPDKYAGIKKEWIPYIQATAKKYGYSEELIISIALSEGYTPVAKHKDEGGKGGLWEVGFGHTTKANHNNKFGKGFEIGIKRAFDWLGQDIKDKEAEIEKFGNHYNYKKIPQPLKEMMIDVAFNRGEARLNPNLKLSKEEKDKGKKQKYDDHYDSAIANIEIKSWGAAAVRFRQEEFSESIKKQGKEGGLRKRNVQRFLRVMDYLTPEKIVGAMDLFNREYYYTKTLGMLNKNEADTLRAQWNNIYYKAKAKCTKQ